MVDILVRVSALLLLVTFAWAGLFKVIRFTDWLSSLDPYQFPTRVRQAVAVGVPIAELTTVTLLAFGNFKIAGAVIIAMLAAFSFAVARARALQGDRLPCGCFKPGDVQDVRHIFLRNAILVILAAFLTLAAPPAEALITDVADLVPLLLVVVGLGVAGWTAVQVAGALKRRESR
jgi:hypothetical protein